MRIGSADFNRGMHIGSADSFVGVGRFNPALATSSNLPIQRQNGPIGFSHVEMGSPPSANDWHTGYPRFISKQSHFMPHMTQNSPSRLGQQTLPRFNHGRSTGPRGNEWNQMKLQLPPPGFNSGGQRSPGNSSLSNGMPWGRRADHPFSNIPPASLGRKDYERIA
ncbi:dual specificity protein kinase YAK1 homolog [Hibiscus syriacus]|uniref:dual specificity protein kinase YAK1 homolog n=1 Tax=Hibiscus syriacus TaxID=106335 RepID=UPI0019214FB3|nr:dual specificity protein kinase YAK1 homolog [Hibiscus syriacus]